MKYIPSINIESGIHHEFQYIVTPNAKEVLGNIINSFHSGIHSFTIIGNYGTGKSSFIVGLEKDLQEGTSNLVTNKEAFSNMPDFEFMNIVGDYASLSDVLASKLNLAYFSDSKNIFEALNHKYKECKKEGKFLFIVIDEFGKILEYAANNNPERELYFLQKLAEFVNHPSRNVILLTTLHQNFGSYAYKLDDAQRNEWLKIKGRFKEIVFVEPVEQLMFLASEQLNGNFAVMDSITKTNFIELYSLAKKNNILSESLSLETAKKLYPLDPISASCLTFAIQRYGQNERSLFSFLAATGKGSLKDYEPTETLTYNLANVYDYVTYNFYTSLASVNSDTMNWRAMQVAIERVESGVIPNAMIANCCKLVKTIGLLNLFCKRVKLDDAFIRIYATYALDIKNADKCLEKLVSCKIIRFASYKSQYILFEGTDIDIESELYKAATIVPVPSVGVEDISPYIKQKVMMAVSSYYKTGTPRYSQYVISNEPKTPETTDEIDGYINLIFPLSNIDEEIVKCSSKCSEAIVYASFRNVDDIQKRLHEIKKLKYVLDNVVMDDKVAKNEICNQLSFESTNLNDSINHSLTSGNNDVTWYYKGEEVTIRNYRELNELLSKVCDDVYSETPIIRNELINKHKISSAISLARVNLLDSLMEKFNEEELGFGNNFPPEKTIYYTLLKKTGMHRQDDNGNYILREPQRDIISLWQVSMDFLHSTVDKPKKISELIKILKKRPYKIKQGVIDFWLPIFLFTSQQDYALYHDDKFVPNITKEVFELLQKNLKNFSVKAFDISGIRLDFFKQYRQFLRKDDNVQVNATSFIETVKPFFLYYNKLNNYAKHTRKFDTPTTAKFRDVLAKAQDPAKTFFEDLPESLGYRNLNGSEFISQYLDLIKGAINELNTCYDLFINRIEKSVVEHLGLPNDFEEYKPLLEVRFANVKTKLLTPKSKSFFERVMAPSATKKEFYEKIGIVIFDKRLDATKDSEEELLINNILFLLSELDRYSSISSVEDTTVEEIYNFELASSKGDFSKSKTYKLAKSKSQQAFEMQEKIEGLLTGDVDLDVCVLLKMLNERIK